MQQQPVMVLSLFWGFLAVCLLQTPGGAGASFLKAASHHGEGPEEDAGEEGGSEAEGECTDIAKEQFDVVYCSSYMCKECCTGWCVDQCTKYKEADRFGKCSCEGGDPEAASEEFCKGKNETYWEEHRHEPYEAMQSIACDKGCDSCCSAMESFLQQGGLKAQPNFQLPGTCKKCLDKHPLVAKKKPSPSSSAKDRILATAKKMTATGGKKGVKASFAQLASQSAPDVAEEVKKEWNQNIQIHDVFSAEEKKDVKREKEVKASRELSALQIAPDMAEEVKREANENIQIHDTFAAQEKDSKEKEKKVKQDKSLNA